jgi:hypothetical protein
MVEPQVMAELVVAAELVAAAVAGRGLRSLIIPVVPVLPDPPVVDRELAQPNIVTAPFLLVAAVAGRELVIRAQTVTLHPARIPTAFLFQLLTHLGLRAETPAEVLAALDTQIIFQILIGLPFQCATALLEGARVVLIEPEAEVAAEL